MQNIARAAVMAAGLGLIAASTAWAQQPETTRIRGEIEKVDGNMLTVKARDGAEMKVKLADNPRIMAMVKASLAESKHNTYSRVSALPQPHGTQKAIAIHIFLENKGGRGEGPSPSGVRPGITMTNAAVDTTVT